MEEKQISYTPSSSAEEARAQSHNNSPGRLTYIDTNDAASNTDALFRAVGRPDSAAFRKLLETTSAEDIVIKRNNRLLTEYLWMAASWPLAEKRELLQMLKERGAIWSSPLFEALCLSDNPSTIQSTYANHAAGQAPLRDSEGRTLLHYAAVEDLLPITHWLISENVVRAGDGDHMGVTPLLLAAGKGHLATVQYLLSPEGGASIKEQDNNRNTALLWAAVNNRSDVVRWLLLEGGASVDERNRHGSLAYNLTRSPEIKSFLEAFKRCGKDPLNYVITYHAVDVLQRIVVQRKAQKSLTIEERNNLLKISVEQEFPDITRLILEEFTSSEELPLLRDLTSLSENIPLSRALTLCQQMSLRRIQELGKQQYDDAAREARNRSDSGAATSYPLEEKAMNDNLFMLTEAAVPEEVRQQLADFLRANFSLQNAQSEVMRQLYSAIKAPMELVDLDTITAEYNLNIAKPPQGVQQPKEAEAKEVITPHAQKEMIAVRELIGQCIKTHLSAYPELCEALQRLDAYYHDYQTSLAEACSAGTLHDQIFKQYSLLGLGKPRYLTPAAKSCLALPLEKLKRDNNDFGMHTVIRAGDLYFKLSPEGNDCVPGMEFAVTAFYDVVAGVGTAPTRLLRVKGPECSHIYVASKAVLGPNLRHTLQYDWEAFYKQLDSFNFSVQVIVSLLTRPADAKADNFLVIPRTNSQRIIGVDNDLAFASPIVPGPAEHDPGHYPELLCVFFFFPQMQHPIDPEVIGHLLNTHPALLMVDWLSKLDQQNKHYQSLQEAGIFNERELNRLQLPIRFCPNTITTMYGHLQTIKELLSKQKEVTHQQLFETLYPELAKYYGTILDEAKQGAYKSVGATEAHSEPTTPSCEALPGRSSASWAKWSGTVVLDATDKLYERLISLEEAALLRQSPDRQGRDNELSRFARERYANHYAFASREQTLSEAMKELLQQIDYSNLSPVKAALLLKKIEDLSSLEVLCLRGYRIKDRSLMSLLGKLSHLKQLHLQQCEGITVHLIHEIIRCYPKIHIAFDKCKDYRAAALQSAIAAQKDVNVSLLSAVTKQPAYYLIKAGVVQHGENESLKSHQRRLDTQEFHNYLADDSLTEDSASFTPQAKNNLETLLARSADINGANKAETAWQGDLPLHTAFVKGNIALADWLIKQGADASRKDPRCNETPFERLQRIQQQDQDNNKYRIFIDWLFQHHPNIMELVKPEAKQKFLRENKGDSDSFELVSADQQTGQSFPNTPAPSPQLSQEFTFSSSSSSSADFSLLMDACHTAIDRNDPALLEILLQLPCDGQEEFCQRLATNNPANAQELFQSLEKYKEHYPNIHRKEQQEKHTKVQALLNGPRSQEILNLLKCKSMPQAVELVMRSKLSMFSISQENEKSLFEYAQEKNTDAITLWMSDRYSLHNVRLSLQQEKESKESDEVILSNLQQQERQQAEPIVEPLLNNQPSVLLDLAKTYTVSKREEDKAAFQERYAAKETTLAEKQQLFNILLRENFAHNVLFTLLEKRVLDSLRTTPEIAASDKPLIAYILGEDIKKLFRFPFLPSDRNYLADQRTLYHLLKESRIPPTLKLKAYDAYLEHYDAYLDIHQAKQWLVNNNLAKEMRYYLQKSILSKGVDPQLLDNKHTKRLALLSAIERHTVEETVSRLRDIWSFQEKAMHLSPTAKPRLHRSLLKAFLSSSGIEPFLEIAAQIEKQLQEIETPSHGGFSRLEIPFLYWHFNDEPLENTGLAPQVFLSAIAGDEHDSGFETLGITRKKLALFLTKKLRAEERLSSLGKMLSNKEIPTPLHNLIAKEYQTLLLAGKLNDIATEAELNLKRKHDESQDASQKQQILKLFRPDTDSLMRFVKIYLGQQGPFPYSTMIWYVKEHRHHYQLWEKKEDGQIQLIAGGPPKTAVKPIPQSAEADQGAEEMKTSPPSNAHYLSGVKRILAVDRGICYQRLALTTEFNAESINTESARELEVLCLYLYFLHYLYLNLSEGCQEEKHRATRNKLINFLRYIARNEQTTQKTLEDVKSLLNTPIIFADDKPSVIGMQHPDILEILAEVEGQQFRPINVDSRHLAKEKTDKLEPEPSPNALTVIRRLRSEYSLSAYRESNINPDHLYEEARIKLTVLLSTLNKKQLQPYLRAWEAERKYQEQTDALSMIERRSSRQEAQLQEANKCLLREREIMATLKIGLLGTTLPANIPTLTDLDALLAIKYRLDKRRESPSDTPFSNTPLVPNQAKLNRYKDEIHSMLADLERIEKLTLLDLSLRVSLGMVHSRVIEIEKVMPRHGEKYQTPQAPVSLSQELADNFYTLFCDMAMAMIAQAEQHGQHHLNTIIHASPEAGLIIKPLRLSDGLLQLLSPILGLQLVPAGRKPESPDQHKRHQRQIIERLGVVVVKHYHQQIALISLAKESQGPQEFAKFLLTLTCLFMFSEESAHAKTPDDILHWLDTPRNLMLPKGIRYTGEKISLVGKGKATCSDLVYRSGYRCKVQGTPEQADDNDEETILYAFKTPGHPGPLPEFGFRNATPDQAQGFQKAIYDARSMNTWYDYPSAPPEPRLTPETVSTYQDPKQRYTHVDFAFEPTPATVNPEIHILRTRVTELEQENANLKAKYEASQAENIQLRSENTETKNEMAGLIEASERRMAENNAEHARQMEERIRQVTAESTESARQDREASEQRLRERDTEHLGKIQQITEENARQVKESAEQAEKQRREHAQQMQEIMKLMEIMTKKKPDQSSEEENNAASGGRSSEAAAAENTTPLPCRR